MKLLNLILKILVLTCLGVALIERNPYSMICGCVLLLNLELEKICDAIREKGLKNERNKNV